MARCNFEVRHITALFTIIHLNRFISTLLCLLLVIGLACGETFSAVPAVVVQLAESYASAQTNAEKMPLGRTLLEEYALHFYQGFTHPHGGILTISDIYKTAYTEGQYYWREHPNERNDIFAGYGYVPVEKVGTWSIGFERSSFVPEDQGEEKWSVSSLGDVKWSELTPGQVDPTFTKARVRIIGYLSPIGSYGHLGGYRREILATSFTLSPLPATPREILLRLKLALTQRALLNKEFYDEESLKSFFGERYTFRANASQKGQVEFFFNDLGNLYVSENGSLTDLGRHRPCFQGGAIFFDADDKARKTSASVAITTSARITDSSSFYADLVEEIFGAPSSVRIGYPSAPPLHGRPYISEKSTHKFGNSWIRYNDNQTDSVSNIDFRTLGDGVVVEIQITVIKK